MNITRAGLVLLIVGLFVAYLYLRKNGVFGRQDIEEAEEEEGEVDDGKALAKKVAAHFKKGTKHYTNEEYKQAIKQWKKVLVLDPENKSVKKAIKEARAKQKKKREQKLE